MYHPIAPRIKKPGWKRYADFLPLFLCFALLIGVGFLPPDTSRAEVADNGKFTVCMPANYPPLVTGQTDMPGFEVELLQIASERLGWRLTVVTNAAMGRDFNPRSWRVNRAQCQALAGGIVLSDTTQSFLDTTKPHLKSGWALIAPRGVTFDDVSGSVGVLVGLTGLDRIGLGQHLRQNNIQPVLMNSATALRTGLVKGQVPIGIAEATLASEIADAVGYDITLLGAPLQHINLGIGFWKGDVTLQRQVEAILAEMRTDGTMQALAERYKINPQFLCLNSGFVC
jgi:ABC-type amino acid transport substrate-binding protein